MILDELMFKVWFCQWSVCTLMACCRLELLVETPGIYTMNLNDYGRFMHSKVGETSLKKSSASNSYIVLFNIMVI